MLFYFSAFNIGKGKTDENTNRLQPQPPPAGNRTPGQRLLMLFLNNKTPAGVKHPLPGCSDLEEPDQTGGCQND